MLQIFFSSSRKLRAASSWAPRNLLFDMQREFILKGLSEHLKDVKVPNNGDPIVLTMEYPPHMSIDGIRAALDNHDWGADFEPDWPKTEFYSHGFDHWLVVRIELKLTGKGAKTLVRLHNKEAESENHD